MTLRELRQSKKVTLQELSAAIDMNAGHLSRVERAEPSHPASPTMLRAIAHALRVTEAAAIAAWLRTVNTIHKKKVKNLVDASAALAAVRIYRRKEYSRAHVPTRTLRRAKASRSRARRTEPRR